MNTINLLSSDGLVTIPVGTHITHPSLHIPLATHTLSPAIFLSTILEDDEFNTAFDDCYLLTSEEENSVFPPEGLKIPTISRDTDPIIDKDVGWNTLPDSPYPLPSLDPLAPAYDLPIILPIDGIHEHLFTALVDSYKDIFVNDIPIEGSSLPPYELHMKPDFKFSKPHNPRRFPQAISEFILEKISELIRLGIIIAVIAAHAADLVVVMQKGKYRMCVNYTETNSG